MLTSSKDIKNAERFEVAFNQIHEALKRIVKIKDDRFTVLVRVGSKHHQIIDTYKEDLEQYAKLRNSLVHDKVEIGYYIAEPHTNIVEHIEKIATIFKRPNHALSIATKNVIFFQEEDHIQKVIQGIKRFSYSQYPIYRGKRCIGLLTTESIVKWMATNIADSKVELTNILVSDIMQYEKAHPISFVPKSINIFEIEELFEEAHKTRSTLEAVIITENGQPDQVPLGIITAWDLIEIDYTID
ncbi:putative transcriptional regulator [Bacillus mesophilus]|uniref:CBS domain-containing protein n=1 Tax=Bacillus mesophilus TaxID=1808955 RepID=A0A6M0Q8L6_9BACI|nr:CBS domain-containing protein [Bacillus mesophilus]MBM7661939.1 putative transcriptional regulator [Bacillus mesophilus]NEY72702.1 CBS domain-containing protein [Bacillus mesophilus]